MVDSADTNRFIEAATELNAILTENEMNRVSYDAVALTRTRASNRLPSPFFSFFHTYVWQ